MKKQDKIIKWTTVGLLIFAGVLFLLGTVFDLQISKKTANVNAGEYFTHNGFVNFLEAFAELPVYVLIVFSVGVCGSRLASREKKALKTVYLTLTGILVFIVAIIGAYRMVNTLGEIYDFQEEAEKPLAIICYVLTGLISVGLEFWFLFSVSEEKINELYYFCWACIIIVALSVVVTQALKVFWARPRFRALVSLDDYSSFKAWYLPSFGKKNYGELGKDAFKSFPSGHCSFAASLIALSYLPKYIKTSKRAEYFAFFTPVCYLMIVASSRIVAGAHFLTDVVAGSMLTVAIIAITFKAIKKVEKKYSPKVSVEYEEEQGERSLQ